MFSVLIVDDEPFIREALRSLVPWEEYGFSITKELYNGKEALAYFDQNPVDLVVTDIKMPVMDGLTLIKELNSYPNDFSILVLSAYDEFHLVKEAFKMGVKDYILKSELGEEQFRKLLQSVGEELNRKKNGSYFIRENLFHLLMTGDGTKTMEKASLLQDIGINLYSGGFVVFQFFSSDNGLAFNRIAEFLEEKGIGFLVNMKESETALLCSFPSSFSWLGIQQFFDEMYSKVRHRLSLLATFDLTIGVSTLEKDYKQITKLFREAGDALHYYFFRGKNRIIYPFHIKQKKINVEEDFKKRYSLFHALLKKRDFESLQDCLLDYCVKENECGAEHIGAVKKLYQHYYFYIVDFLEQNSFLKTEAVREVLDKFSRILSEHGDILELNRVFAHCLKTLSSASKLRSSLVSKVIRYIHENYSGEITLSRIAEYLNISRGYLSRTFSREVGCSLTRYVSKIRMEYAAEYLVETDMKIYEIAERVGYSNSEHFSRTFKKVMGKSPKRFIE